MSKTKVTRKKRPPAAIREVPLPSRVSEADALMDRLKPPLLKLDDVVLVSSITQRAPGDPESLVLSGEKLAHLLSYVEMQGVPGSTLDRDAVSVRLRGLANLLDGHFGREGCHIDADGAYFIHATLEDFSSWLDATPNTESFRVGLLEPRTKAVAS